MQKSAKQKLRSAFLFTLTVMVATAMLKGAGLLGERWQHERQAEARQLR